MFKQTIIRGRSFNMKYKSFIFTVFFATCLCSCSGVNSESTAYYDSIKNELLTNHDYYKYTLSFVKENTETEIILGKYFCSRNEVFFSYDEDRPMLFVYDENTGYATAQVYNPSNKTYVAKEITYTNMLFYKFIFLEYLPFNDGIFVNKPIDNVKGFDTYLDNFDVFLELSSSLINNVELKDKVLTFDFNPNVTDNQTYTLMHYSMEQSDEGVITIQKILFTDSKYEGNCKIVLQSINQNEFNT